MNASNIYEFDGFIPVIHESAYVHPNATVTGNVIIGRDVYIGPGAAIRGDWGGIVIEDGCNVQENCTVQFSWTLQPSSMTMPPQSPRIAAPGPMYTSRPMMTFPVTVAFGCT